MKNNKSSKVFLMISYPIHHVLEVGDRVVEIFDPVNFFMGGEVHSLRLEASGLRSAVSMGGVLGSLSGSELGFKAVDLNRIDLDEWHLGQSAPPLAKHQVRALQMIDVLLL